MGITSKNIVKHELIGLHVEILKSMDPTLHGLNGHVEDETQNTLIIQAEKKRKQIPKRGTDFRFHLSNGKTANVEGALLVHRPHERIKGSKTSKKDSK